MIRNTLPALLLLLATSLNAQTYKTVKGAWQRAGYTGTKPVFPTTLNVHDYGADTTGAHPCDAALTGAITALNGRPGNIYFPAGTYLFNEPIHINRDSIVLRGAGYDATVLRFRPTGGASNLINIAGTASVDTSALSADAMRGATSVSADRGTFHAGDWLNLSMDDRDLMTSSWAYGSLAQTFQINAVVDDTLFFSSPLRASFFRAKRATLRRIIPRNNIGIECLKIQRMDATPDQTSNIVFDYAANCWVTGVESDSANFAHIEINRSANIDVTGCYIHGAFAYGGGGQGYGILVQFGSGECRAEANYFNHLRHSMVLQAGPMATCWRIIMQHILTGQSQICPTAVPAILSCMAITRL